MKDYSKYESPFSWRYGSEEMRKIFSEENKYKLWRKIWVALARAQAKVGLVSKEELTDLEKHQNDIDIERIWEIEKDTAHDVVAAIKEFAEKAKVGGGKIHLGATSMDISDNAETVRISQALEIIEDKLKNLLKEFSAKIEKYASTVCMGYTHLQPAEPTTLGYRFAFYAQDLLMDFEFLRFVKKNLKAKGFKGAVGTSASYVKLLNLKKAKEMEEEIIEELGVDAFEITNQTAPRKIEFWISSLLSSIAQSLYKFAFDVRLMQSPGFGEWQEPFGEKQVGSSAMPFKKNPVKSEQICSLVRLVVSLSRVPWDNASHMLLERTLDDSANRRIVIPEMFLATDSILLSATNILSGLTINHELITQNLNKYWFLSSSEVIMVKLVQKGMDRQEAHELLRKIAMEGGDPRKELSKDDMNSIMDAKDHIGLAPKNAKELAEKIKKI